jgi:hypothetical protein
MHVVAGSYLVNKNPPGSKSHTAGIICLSVFFGLMCCGGCIFACLTGRGRDFGRSCARLCECLRSSSSRSPPAEASAVALPSPTPQTNADHTNVGIAIEALPSCNTNYDDGEWEDCCAQLEVCTNAISSNWLSFVTPPLVCVLCVQAGTSRDEMDLALARMHDALSAGRVRPSAAHKQRVIAVVLGINRDAAKHACWDTGLATSFSEVLAAVGKVVDNKAHVLEDPTPDDATLNPAIIKSPTASAPPAPLSDTPLEDLVALLSGAHTSHDDDAAIRILHELRLRAESTPPSMPRNELLRVQTMAASSQISHHTNPARIYAAYSHLIDALQRLPADQDSLEDDPAAASNAAPATGIEYSMA